MIKVNLASRKQSNLTNASSKARGTLSFQGLKIDALDFQALKELPLAKIGGAVVLLVVLMVAEGSVKQEQMRKVQDELAVVGERRASLQAELDKTKGFDAQKKALETDEMVLRTKIDTIQKLIHDRQIPPKLLIALSNGLPPDVWLSEFTIGDQGIKMKGRSLGFTEISDFMKNLGESAYFSDLKLEGTKKVRDELGFEIAEFDLSAKRRSSP